MEHCLNLPNRYAMILDTETIRAAVAHAAQLNLSRRECHPLDRYRGKCANADLLKFDAEADAAPLTTEELEYVEAVDAALDTSAPNAIDP